MTALLAAAVVVYVCAWCNTPLAGDPVDAAGLQACSDACAQQLLICSDCGGDIRVKSDPEFGPVACTHQAGWVL